MLDTLCADFLKRTSRRWVRSRLSCENARQNASVSIFTREFLLSRRGKTSRRYTQQPFFIVTTMLDAKGENAITKDEISELFGFRWNVELDCRSIKSNMNLAHVRCKSPEMVHREFWTTMLAYNLIRTTIAIAATLADMKPRQISFTSACQFVLAGWQEICRIEDSAQLGAYCRKMLLSISQCVVGDRPGRFEPRVVKRRKDQYKKMMEPRIVLRERLERNDNSFE